MFLRHCTRKKDGKEHRYWSLVENRRLSDGRVVQRHVLYLGEINSSQQAAWRRSVEVLSEEDPVPLTLSLFAEDRCAEVLNDASVVRLKLSELQVRRPRQWGACWLALELWRELQLDRFWRERLPRNRKGTRWNEVLAVLTVYRLVSPGSEWRLHREWFERSALSDLLNGDFRLAEIHRLYECHDRLLAHKAALFDHLHGRWRDLFNPSFEVLLYDLTSTYFESDPPEDEEDKRRFGYSRDKRPDCVQVVLALIVTPDGFPLAYEMMAGDTADKTTLEGFLEKIETQYGKAQRIWVMDRGIPTEEVLEKMRRHDPPVQYLVGTPKGRLSRLEKRLVDLPWQEVREGVEVKLLADAEEVMVLARSVDRVAKERSMRRRQLKRLWKRLAELSGMELNREQLLMKLGAAQNQSPSAWRLVEVKVDPTQAAFSYQLLKAKLRQVRQREGRYLLRTNLKEGDPVRLWRLYVQLVAVEQAFKEIKGDLGIRPIHHQLEGRIESHIFVCFMAYCLQVTLSYRLKQLAPGLTARSVMEKFAAVAMVDVHIPTVETDPKIRREIILTRYTQPEAELRLLLEKLKMELPQQPPPRIASTDVPTPGDL